MSSPYRRNYDFLYPYPFQEIDRALHLVHLKNDEIMYPYPYPEIDRALHLFAERMMEIYIRTRIQTLMSGIHRTKAIDKLVDEQPLSAAKLRSTNEVECFGHPVHC